MQGQSVEEKARPAAAKGVGLAGEQEIAERDRGPVEDESVACVLGDAGPDSEGRDTQDARSAHRGVRDEHGRDCVVDD